MAGLKPLLRVGLVGLACLLLPLAALAQSEPEEAGLSQARDLAQTAASGALGEYYESWQRAADRAERVLDAKKASNGALESLRVELADYRQQFLEAGSQNSDRIKTLRAQLDALGPTPEDSATEPENITRLREEMQRQLAILTAPQMLADLGYSRAQGLISEIDKLIRERATRTLLERVPMPVNPENWPGAVTDAADGLAAFWHETSSLLDSATTREAIRVRLPLLLLLSAVALLLLTRGRHWAHLVGNYLRELGGRGTGVWRFIVSLLQVLLPYIGTLLLVRAIAMSGILGVRGTLLLDYVPLWIMLLYASRWLGERLNVYEITNVLIPYDTRSQGQVRVIFGSLVVVLVLQLVLDRLDAIENFDEGTMAVLSWPLILLASLLLLRLNRIGARLGQAEAEDDSTDDEGAIAIGTSRAISILRRLVFVLAVAAPVLGAIGYINAAIAIVYPTILTLGLIALVLVLQRFLADIYGFLTREGQKAQESLFAVITGFVLALLSLPVLALIWGARVSDLTELWSRFLEGFNIGDTKISPTIFLSFVVVFAVGYLLTRLLQGSLRSSLLPKTKIDPGGQNAIVSGVGYIGIFLAALVAVSAAGLDLSSLAIVAGALSVGIGFGLQTIVSNFVSGIILLIERPISKGDWIEVGGMMGYVRDISVRSTRIETFDRTDLIVPNSDLISGTVTNYTRGNTVGRVIVPVGVAYGTSPRKVEEILMAVAKGHPMVLMNPAPAVVFQGFGADSLDFEIRAILRDVNWVLSVKSDMNYEIAKRFEEEGIEIPFAQRDIWIRNPEAIKPAPQEDGEAPQAPTAPSAAPSSEPARPDLADVSQEQPETEN
ncbi:MAG: mechanosensitive ion channel protein MscS [Alphaproteobacteria bacterium MedPE-SWcel]|nr:MAG: mechanosensitive ion channel protein MscS [Alphaproteobacteria bacterium MedPE-SWcel]